MGLFRRKPTWHERHPLPEGWRPRTRVDVTGRQVEPWVYLVTDAYGYALDGGEHWLPVRLDPDAAAYEILTWWLEGESSIFLEPHELPGLRVAVRPAAYAGSRVGVAFAVEQALAA
jgi:hypothetical protein